jgi:protein-S-isoprenylcysteine O-methyltransferase Ste14
LDGKHSRGRVQKSYSSSLLRIADRLDQALLVILFAGLCLRLLPSGLAGNWYNLMLVVSEAIVVVFVLIRRPTNNITVHPGLWAVAAGGTMAPMLVEGRSERFWPELGLETMIVGTLLQVGAKLALRRSFGIVAADRGVKFGGPYAIVRHPMYLGYMITHVGFFLSVPSAWNLSVYALTWTLLIARIVQEERLLMRNDAYRAYAARVRYRLIPGLF